MQNPMAQASTGWTKTQRHAFLEGWEASVNPTFTDSELEALAHKAMSDLLDPCDMPEDRLYYRMGFIAGVRARYGN